MTLQDFFDFISEHPAIILFYFIALPLTAFLACVFGKNEGHISPWKFLYSFLIYGACIPGIFSISLNVYLFLFERQSVLDANIYTQILPIIVMGFTLWFISKNVDLDDIPGFDKLGGLMIMIACILALMWMLDRTRIFAITILPFWMVILIVVGLLIVARFGFKAFFASNKT